MRKITHIILLAGFLLCSLGLHAQGGDITTSLQLTGASSDCSVAASCLKVSSKNYALASVSVRGTFTGATVFFEYSDDGGNTWFANTCTRGDAAIQESSEALTNSTARSWDCGVYATGNFRVRQSAITTGGPTVFITLSTAAVEPAATVSIAAGTAAIGNLTPNQGSFTDRSGSIASGGTSQTLVAANTSRKRIIIQNPCNATDQGIAAAENLYINFTSAATVSGGNSFTLQPCGSYDSGFGPVTTELITVIATTVSHKFVAKEQ